MFMSNYPNNLFCTYSMFDALSSLMARKKKNLLGRREAQNFLLLNGSGRFSFLLNNLFNCRNAATGLQSCNKGCLNYRRVGTCCQLWGPQKSQRYKKLLPGPGHKWLP